MRYVEFKESILAELRRSPDGLTWAELKSRLALPHERPCPTWVGRMEQEAGLQRKKGAGTAYVWTVSQGSDIEVERSSR